MEPTLPRRVLMRILSSRACRGTSAPHLPGRVQLSFCPNANALCRSNPIQLAAMARPRVSVRRSGVHGRWRAQLSTRGRTIHLGTFATAEEAAR